MKKGICIAGVVLATTALNAQIKVWPGGITEIGSTTATSLNGGYKMQVVGNTAFTSGTGTVSSCPYIIGTTAYSPVSTPDYTWKKDSMTGIGHPASGILNFSNSATEIGRFTTNGLLLGITTDPTNVKLYVAATPGKEAIYSTSSYTADYSYHQINNVNRGLTKAVVVQLNGTDNFNVYGSGDVWGKTWTGWSDRTLKENFDSIRNPLKKVLQLNGMSYNFKSSVTGLVNNKKEIGLIAQDVEQIVPEVVNTSDKGIKGIAYQNLIALLIEAIKEQNKKITQLQNDLAVCCPKPGTGNRTINHGGSGEGKNGGSMDNSIESGAQGKLWQNVPNPFNQTTIIKCLVPDAGKTASLLVFDMNGTLKKTIQVNGKGEVNVTINAKELIAGMYFYSLIIDGNEIDTKKMILTE